MFLKGSIMNDLVAKRYVKALVDGRNSDIIKLLAVMKIKCYFFSIC